MASTKYLAQSILSFLEFSMVIAFTLSLSDPFGWPGPLRYPSSKSQKHLTIPEWCMSSSYPTFPWGVPMTIIYSITCSGSMTCQPQ